MVWVFLMLGVIFGSFLAALTWRLPRQISVSKGRSFCPNCRNKIEWYDNIPVLSYFLLGGKCRSCKITISPRYPLIEFLQALLFVFIFLFLDKIILNLTYLSGLPIYITLPYLLFLVFLFLGIFVVDLENMIIPDEFVFVGILLTLGVFVLTGIPFYINLFTGFIFGLVFLMLNLVTLGRGMGLGDVKLVVLIGLVLGPKNGLLALFISFIVGAIVGIILLAFKKAKFSQKIAFGPFLVIGFLGSLLFAHEILRLIQI